MKDFNKNSKQQNFNQIKGVITELNDGEKFCHMTLQVGHENPRFVNGIIKKDAFDKIKEKHIIGDKVAITFYVSSKQKDNRWRTMVNIMDVEAVLEPVKV